MSFFHHQSSNKPMTELQTWENKNRLLLSRVRFIIAASSGCVQKSIATETKKDEIESSNSCRLIAVDIKNGMPVSRKISASISFLVNCLSDWKASQWCFTGVVCCGDERLNYRTQPLDAAMIKRTGLYSSSSSATVKFGAGALDY